MPQISLVHKFNISSLLQRLRDIRDDDDDWGGEVSVSRRPPSEQSSIDFDVSGGGGVTKGPGGIGSYLSRQEFGSTEEHSQAGGGGGVMVGGGENRPPHDSSGYVSHGSGGGGGAYPKLQLPVGSEA